MLRTSSSLIFRVICIPLDDTASKLTTKARYREKYAVYRYDRKRRLISGSQASDAHASRSAIYAQFSIANDPSENESIRDRRREKWC